jgi:MSHA biogenesis protein MshM
LYQKHFGLHSKPFLITPETLAFYTGGNRKSILESIKYVLSNEEGIIKLTGEVGAGKTTVCRYLIKHLGPNFKPIYIADPTLSREQILFAVADGLEMEFDRGDNETMALNLQRKLAKLHESGRRVVLIIDEAHAIPEESLDQIRLLSQIEASGDKIMHVLLVGPEELDHNLALPELRAVRDRITQSFRLRRLKLRDIADYLQFKMRACGYEGPPVFTQNAIRLIGRLTNGLPRRINIIADKALLSAALDQRFEVGTRDIANAAREIKLERVRTKGDSWLIGVGGFFAGATVATVLLSLAVARGWVAIGPYSTPSQALQTPTVIQGAPSVNPGSNSVSIPTQAPSEGTNGQNNGQGTNLQGTTATTSVGVPQPPVGPNPAPNVDTQSILTGVVDGGNEYSFKAPKPPDGVEKPSSGATSTQGLTPAIVR